MNHWIRPSCDSRTGASHLRRGAPCQDASGFVGFLDAAGSPIQALVVSDGHGGSRYVRSDVGARLACEVAMRELQQALAPARVADPGALEDWRGWLSEELPGRIVAAWRREVEAHWRDDPAADGSAFTPVVYGATLGVLLLTPAWWAHTGLGDWDLVRLEAAGGDTLLSEEPEREASGEATFSLCLERAERCFAPRTVLEPLTPETPPFALLLCSDGLRKSCGSDSDFLTLSRYLVGLSSASDAAGSAELAEALDHISRQGSGDDISVAVARWSPVSQAAAWPEPGRCPPPQLVQPSPGAPSGPSQPLAATAPCDPPAAGLPDPLLAGSPSPAASASTSLPPGAGRATPRRARDRQLAAPGRLRPLSRLLVAAAALLGLGGAGLVMATRLGVGPLAVRRPPPPLALTPQQRSDLQRQVRELCGPPAAAGVADNRDDSPRGDVPRGKAPLASARSGSSRPAAKARPGAAANASPPAGPVAIQPAGAIASSAAPQAPRLPASSRREPGAGAGHPFSSVQRELAPGPATTGTAPAVAAAATDPQRQQRLAATLATRASVFQRLASGEPALVADLLRRSAADPLSALIAASATDASLRPTPPAQPSGWRQDLARRFSALLPFAAAPGRDPDPSPLARLGACPELRQALRASWQRHGAAGTAPMTAASASAIAPPRAASASHGVPAASGPLLPGRGDASR